MRQLEQVQQWLKTNNLEGMLIPSTDEFLSEFAPESAQRLRWAMGFRGSVGLAIVLQDETALFVDGRYLLQAQAEAAAETDGAAAIEVVLTGESVRERWVCARLRRGNRLALDPALHAVPEVNVLRAALGAFGIELVLLNRNPIDDLWHEGRPSTLLSSVDDYPLAYAGQTLSSKSATVRHWLHEHQFDGYLLSDPLDVAWLLNVRARDAPFDPICLSLALLETSGFLTWFVDQERLTRNLCDRLDKTVQIAAPAQLEAVLTERVRGKTIGANLRRTSCKLANIVVTAGGEIRDCGFIERCRWRKNPAEIGGARRAHHLDGQAVIRLLAWLERTLTHRSVTELEAAAQLREFREALPDYQGPSMPMMSASGINGALPHYVPADATNRSLNDHPIFWLDSGGQYLGGTTDNTVCVAVGIPEPKHKLAHTLVLKGFIAMAELRFPTGTLASQLDSFGRQFLWRQGMDYRHATSHGVGSYSTIHEGPVIGKYHIHSPLNAPVEPDMILSNEPAYYAAGDFGVRIESHLLTVQSSVAGYLEFETLSRLPIDPALVEFSLLTTSENDWLADYHRCIAADYKGKFDEPTSAWLQRTVARFV